MASIPSVSEAFLERRGSTRCEMPRQAELAAAGLSEPDARLLPSARQERFPVGSAEDQDHGRCAGSEGVSLDAGRFSVTALTPVLFGKAQVQDDLKQAANRYSRRGKKIKDDRYDPVDEPFYDWVRNASGYLDYVVTFEIKPDFGETTGSAWSSALSAVAAGLNKTAAAPTRQTMEFKAEFADLSSTVTASSLSPSSPDARLRNRRSIRGT